MHTDSVLNPYLPFLADRDIYEVLESTPEKLTRMSGDVPRDRLTRRAAPDRWSIHDILCHLADTEIAYAFRLRQTVAEANHTIQPYDQDLWALPYDRFNSDEALHSFSALRRWNLAFIRAAGPDALEKPVTHPERGPMTFEHILETMAGHDVNHMRQIEALARG